MYQFGVLSILFVLITVPLTVIVVALSKGNFEAIAGLLIGLLLVYWFGNFRSPIGLGGRLFRLFRDGVPLAPYGFKSNATLGYWLGIPMIYIGHIIILPTLYLGWELSKNPIVGIPLGIPIGFGLMFYSGGVGLVESSYRLWAEEELDGAVPGDPGSSPLKPFVWSVSVATVMLAAGYLIETQPKQPASDQGIEVAGASEREGPTPAVRVTLADFLPLANPGWTGEYQYRDRESGQFLRVPAAMTATLSEGKKLNLSISIADASGEPIKLSFTLNDAGNRLNQLAIVERSELPNGRLAIAAVGNDQHSGARSRLRFLFSTEDFWLELYDETEPDQLSLRNKYTFKRGTRVD